MTQQSFSHPDTSTNRLYALPLRPPELLIGRSADLETLHLPLKQRRAILLYGPLGIGKTALAAKIASDFTSESRDVLWIESMDDSLDALLLRAAREYELDEAAAGTPRADRIAAVSAVLDDQSPFVVIDGSINLNAVREFIVNCAIDIPLIVTASHPEAGPWSKHAVNRLDYADAEALLRHVAGDTLEADAADITALNGILAGHPLSIVITGRQLAATTTTPTDLIQRIPEMPSGETNHAIGILMANYRLLSPSLQGILLLASTTHGGTATTELLHDAAGLPLETIQRGLTELLERGFIFSRSQYEQITYGTHEVVQTFADAFLRGKGQRDTMHDRQIDALIHFLEQRITSSDPDQQDEIAAETSNILAAARFAAQNNHPDYVQKFVALLESGGAEQFVSTRDFEPEINWIRQLAEHPETAAHAMLESTEDLIEDSMPVAEDFAESLTEPAEDIIEPTLVPSRTFPDVEASSETETEIGAAVDAAQDMSQDASRDTENNEDLEVDTEVDSEAAHPIQAIPDDATDSVEDEDLGLSEAAPPVEAPRQPLPFAQTAPPSLPEPELTPETGGVTDPTSTTNDEAVPQAPAFQADGSIDDELAALEALAEQSLENENYDEVLAYVDQGLKTAQDANNPHREARMLTILGDLQVMLNRDDGAETAYKEAIEALRPSESWLEIALILDKLGYLYIDQDRHTEAADVWLQSLPIFERENQTD